MSRSSETSWSSHRTMRGRTVWSPLHPPAGSGLPGRRALERRLNELIARTLLVSALTTLAGGALFILLLRRSLHVIAPSQQQPREWRREICARLSAVKQR